jgi:leader peptidase (prepilin peptidase) / N-methyltransferase
VTLFRVIPFALFGLVFGSFLNVLVYRLPRKLSVVAPPSACPSCGMPIRARDNIPVASYLLLRGRCRDCHTSISAEYPIVEAVTAGGFIAAGLAFTAVSHAALIAPFLGVLLACSLIDVRHRIIPNTIVLSGVVLFALAILALWGGTRDLDPVTALLGLLAYGGGLFLVALASLGGMGMGDVKLGALIGLVLGALGWRYVGVAALFAVLAGGVGAILALLTGQSRKDTIPFGPFMALGATVSAFLAPQITAWYAALPR